MTLLSVGLYRRSSHSLAVCWKGTLAQGGLPFLSVSGPVSLLQVRRRPVMVVVFICNLMMIGRWCELSVNKVCQEHEGDVGS